MNNETSIKKSQTDWARIDSMTDEEIDFTDCPEVTDEMWEKVILRKNYKPILRINQENFPIDKETIEFFKSRDFNYPAKINEVLREFIEKDKTSSG